MKALHHHLGKRMNNMQMYIHIYMSRKVLHLFICWNLAIVVYALWTVISFPDSEKDACNLG